ncbi:YolD-like family protein [Bacillus weihaiensis]|uniref:YolD-like family protein n=1 Tax=Bacillus weihaiensis TaxID=1547283 RepID=UPI001F1ED4E9|nr:YolD-like family protein [Bacillus weihaiensis]
MTIRYRGKMKWESASFIPLAFEITSEMFKDQARQPKPILDEHQTEEFDLRIAFEAEYNHAVKLTVWMTDYSGPFWLCSLRRSVYL